MEKFSKNIIFTFLIFITLISLSSVSSSSPSLNNCADYKLPNNKVYTACNNLPVLNSSLYWNYYQSNHTVEIAYRHTSLTAANWAAWSLNPSGGAMIGAQCLVAFRKTNGLISAYTSSITSYATRLEVGPLSFEVPKLAAEFAGDQMTIYATIELPNGTTTFTHLWQHGNVFDDIPGMHPTTGDHMRSIGSIDFATGLTVDAPVGVSRNFKRNVHGILNVVSWGILVPICAMLARYLKVFGISNPIWFNLHRVCQLFGFVVGVAGWATGIKLGVDSPGVVHMTHRNIGISIFALATIQVFIAIVLRPKPDAKYRIYWNISHQVIGYSAIILSIVNVFLGFDILDPEKKRKKAYIGFFISLGASCVLLEAIRWFIVIMKRKEQSASDEIDASANV